MPSFCYLSSMLKYLAVFLVLIMPRFSFGQLKYDANWVFGERCGVDFRDANNPVSFYSVTKNDEPNASISDSAGNLQLYLSYNRTYSWMPVVIRDGQNETVINSEGIKVHFSATNGAIFLPVPGRNDSIYLFHIGEYSSSCGYNRCYRLYYSLLALNSSRQWETVSKNIPMFFETVEESITLVKKANGIDWWLITQKQRTDVVSGGMFYVFNISDFITFKDSVTLNSHNSQYSYVGELDLNRNGNLLIDIVGSDNYIFFNHFDRCTGLVSIIDTVVFSLVAESVYSGCIYEPYIYISTEGYGSGNATGNIYRCRIYNDSVSIPTLFYQGNISGLQMGQLERSPDGNIWVSYRYIGSDSTLKQTFQKHLAIIENPESDTARFVLNHLFMGDSASVYWGLPNFPNYNLGPEGVFLASAGRDTAWCSNTSLTGVALGTPLVPNIIYTWQPAAGLSATNVAQPLANPTQSTWYYLTATDTTAISCAVNTDSVYVEVRVCTGVNETVDLQAKLYPNPTNGKLTIELSETAKGYSFEMFNLLGQKLQETPLSQTHTSIQINYPAGIYIYRIVGDGKVQSGKLVVE